jgi:hypothetical protein
LEGITMNSQTIIKAIDRLKTLYNLTITGKYDPKSDDMTGSIYINGKETNIIFPCSNERLFRELYWMYHSPTVQQRM